MLLLQSRGICEKLGGRGGIFSAAWLNMPLPHSVCVNARKGELLQLTPKL